MALIVVRQDFDGLEKGLTKRYPVNCFKGGCMFCCFVVVLLCFSFVVGPIRTWFSLVIAEVGRLD